MCSIDSLLASSDPVGAQGDDDVRECRSPAASAAHAFASSMLLTGRARYALRLTLVGHEIVEAVEPLHVHGLRRCRIDDAADPVSS